MLSRKATLNTEILANTELLKIWLNNLIQISSIHSRKEYKKGSKINNLLNLTFL